MVVVAFIKPPQVDVVEWILRGHQSAAMVGGLWRSSASRASPSPAHRDGVDGAHSSDSDPNELTYIDMDTFLANFKRP